MKKKISVIILSLLLVLSLVVSPINVKVARASNSNVLAKSVSITDPSYHTYTISKGSTKKLSARISPTNVTSTKLKWESSDKSIVSVSSKGIITGIKTGTAKITVTTTDESKKKATIYVTVGTPVKEIRAKTDKLTLMAGKTSTIKTTITPSTASIKKLEYKSSDEKIATVTKAGMIKAISAGKATITIAARDGSGKKEKVYVTVKEKMIDKTLTQADVVDGKINLSDATYHRLIIKSSVGDAEINLDHIIIKDAIEMESNAKYAVKAKDSEINNVVALEEKEEAITSFAVEDKGIETPTFIAEKGTLVVTIDARGNISVIQESAATIGAIAINKKAEGSIELNLEGFNGNLVVNASINGDVVIQTKNCNIAEALISGTSDGQNMTLSDNTENGSISSIGKIKVETNAKLNIDVPVNELMIAETVKNASITVEKPIEKVVNDGSSTSLTVNSNVASIISSGDIFNMKVTTGSTVKAVEASGNSSKIEVGFGSTVESVVSAGNSSQISGTGSVKNVQVEGNNTIVDTPNTIISVGEKATGTTANGANISAGSTQTPTPAPITQIIPVAPTPTATPTPTSDPDFTVINGVLTSYHGSKAEVTIPNSLNIKSIGDSAFLNNKQITSIVIQEGVTSINYMAFNGCSNLATVTLPDSLLSISWFAFGGCAALTRINIPKNVNAIESSFTDTPRLTSFTVDKNNQYFSAEDGILYNHDKTIIVRYPEGKPAAGYVFPTTVTKIANTAFYSTDVTSIVIPEGVTSLGRKSFDNSGLTSISLPSTLKEIQFMSFYGTAITEITIPESVETIEDFAFGGCLQLTTLNLPKNVRTFDGAVFEYTRNMSSITVDSENPYFTATNGILYNKDITKLVYYPQNKNTQGYELPDTVSKIGTRAFYGSDINRLVIPKTVIEIAEDAFLNCHNLTICGEEGSAAQVFSTNQKIPFEKIMADVTVIGITVKTAPTKTFYTEGDNLVLAGLVVTLEKSNSTVEDVVLEDFAAKGITTQKEAGAVLEITDTAVVITINGKSTSQEITVSQTPVTIAQQFPDANLASAIADWLGLNVGSRITEGMIIEQVKTKNVLDLSGLNISDMTGFDIFDGTGLAELQLNQNSLEQFDASGLTSLTRLDISNNELLSLNVSGLTNLKYLDTSNNQLSFLDIQWLTNLERLCVFPMTSKEIYGLSDHNLDYLDINDTMLIDLKADGKSVLGFDSEVWSYSVEVPNGTTAVPGVTVTPKDPSAKITIIPATSISGETKITVEMSGQYRTYSVKFEVSSNPDENSDPEFTIYNGQLMKYNGDGGAVVIPQGVVDVESGAFAQNTSITSIYFPESVEYVGWTYNGGDPLAGCTNLTSLTYSNTMKFLELNLNEHPSIKELNIYKGTKDSIAYNDLNQGGSGNTTIEKISIGEGLTEIDTFAFQKYAALKEVKLPASLKVIGQEAFSGCVNLCSVDLPDALEAINGRAFDGCAGLSKIIIPQGIKMVEYYAFGNCTNLKEISIPNGLTNDRAFGGSTQINSVHITLSPRTTILNSLYTDIKTLDKIFIDEGITAIDYGALRDQTKLEEIHLPGTLISIEDRAFQGCSGLKSITIPSQVYTYATVFADCPNLINVTISYQDYSDINVAGLPDTVQTLTIMEGITKIDSDSFNNLHALKTILLPDSLSEIGSDCFNGCEQLENFKFPKNFSRLYDNCFQDSIKLTELNIPGNQMYFGENIFTNCSELRSLKVYFSGNTDFALYLQLPIEEIHICEGFKRLSNLFSDATTVSRETIKKVGLPETLEEIGSRVFENCTNLNEINIPSSMTTIESLAFHNCTSLMSMVMSDQVTRVGDYAFSGCTGLVNLVISRNLSTIGMAAFENCDNITQLAKPCGVSLGFGNCNIQKLTILYSARSQGIVVNSLDAEEITIEEGYTEIGLSDFRNLFKLKKIYIPGSVQIINSDAFDNCNNIEELVFAKGLTRIYDAFNNCDKLRSVSLPETVEYISGFSGCGLLTTLHITNATLNKLNSTAFKGTSLKLVNITGTQTGNISYYNLPYVDTVQIAEGITSISGSANISCKEVIVPKSVTSISTFICNIWNRWPSPVTMKVYKNSYAHQFAVDYNVLHSIIEEAAENEAVTGVDIIEETKTILLNSEELLISAVLPATAVNKNLTWTSSDTAIATVDNLGHVKGLKEGKATITVTTEEGGFQDSCEVTVYSTTLSKDSVVHRVMNAEGSYTLMNSVCDTNLDLYLENDYFRNTINSWWNLWMGSNLTVDAVNVLKLTLFHYSDISTQAFYDGFYGDLFMNNGVPSALTNNCAEIIYQLIHTNAETVIEVNQILPADVNAANLSLEELAWYLDRADSEAVFKLLNDHDAIITGMESIKDTYTMVSDVLKDIIPVKDELKTTLKSYITANIKNASVDNVSITLSVIGGIVNLADTQQTLERGKALFNISNTSIQRVIDKAELITFFDEAGANNMIQSWENTSKDYSDSASAIVNEANLSGALWFLNKAVDTALGNPIVAAWNLMISVDSLVFNNQIKNSELFSQYCVGNNLLIAAKNVYTTNYVKLVQISNGQLSVTETEFQEIQNNLRSAVSVIYLVKGQLVAYERELTLAFFPEGDVVVPPVNQSSEWKKLGVNFLNYSNVSLEDFVGK